MDGKELARLVSSINLRCVRKISDSVMNKDTLCFLLIFKLLHRFDFVL